MPVRNRPEQLQELMAPKAMDALEAIKTTYLDGEPGLKLSSEEIKAVVDSYRAQYPQMAAVLEQANTALKGVHDEAVAAGNDEADLFDKIVPVYEQYATAITAQQAGMERAAREAEREARRAERASRSNPEAEKPKEISLTEKPCMRQPMLNGVEVRGVQPVVVTVDLGADAQGHDRIYSLWQDTRTGEYKAYSNEQLMDGVTNITDPMRGHEVGLAIGQVFAVETSKGAVRMNHRDLSGKVPENASPEDIQKFINEEFRKEFGAPAATAPQASLTVASTFAPS